MNGIIRFCKALNKNRYMLRRTIDSEILLSELETPGMWAAARRSVAHYNRAEEKKQQNNK